MTASCVYQNHMLEFSGCFAPSHTACTRSAAACDIFTFGFLESARQSISFPIWELGLNVQSEGSEIIPSVTPSSGSHVAIAAAVIAETSQLYG